MHQGNLVRVSDGVTLAERGRDEVLKHIRFLWGYDVSLAGVDAETGKTLYEASSAETAKAT